MQQVEDIPAAEVAVLIARIGRDRDSAAFERLFRHYAPRVRAYMTGLTRDRALAEELTQETMAAVWNKAHLFDPERGNAATWIFTIARNQRIDAFRRGRRPVFDPADPAFVPELEPPAETGIGSRQEAEQLRRALDALPSEQSTLLRLSYFEDRSQSTIAADLGIPLGTVKSRMRLAFARLRSALEADQ